jgi:hypothetical protein
MRFTGALLLGIFVSIASVAFQPAADAAQGWERLGTRIVDFGSDHDTIVVGRDDGRFREVMFEVDGGAVRLYNVRVVFGNGQDFSPVTEFVFSDDERTRAINLPGTQRVIRSINFNYRSLRTGQGRATITVYGR